jgi:hypothetical protein
LSQSEGKLVYVCAARSFIPPIPKRATTDHRISFRTAIALGVLALAVALGVAVHKAYPPAPPSTAASDADTIRRRAVGEGNEIMRAVRFVVLLGTLLVALPMAPSQAAATPTHVRNPCVKVSAHIDPHHVHVGDYMSAGGAIDGCGRSVYIRFFFRFKGPCGPVGGFEGHVRVSRHLGIFYATPNFQACEGTYRMTAKAYHDGRLLGRVNRWVHVLP